MQPTTTPHGQVHVGHSETILRPNVSVSDQPLWWAKGGELIGESPPRIKWFREQWVSNAALFGVLFSCMEQGYVARGCQLPHDHFALERTPPPITCLSKVSPPFYPCPLS
jgi:hypothetical protein